MPYAHLNADIVAQSTGDDKSLTDWLNITQDNIDPRFDVVTPSFVQKLLSQISIGQSPYNILTSQCPVTRRVVPDGVVASYTATVIVNRSETLRGLYTIEADAYEVRGPYQATRRKNGEILTENKKVIELGWLPVTLALVQDYGPTPPLSWTQENGYLYLDQAAKAILWCTGVAEVDRWEVVVEHKQGERFDDETIPVYARWGEDNEVAGEIKIPGCVKAAFNECPRDGFGVGGTDPNGDKWGDFVLNPTPPRTVYYEGCTGKHVETRYDE